MSRDLALKSLASAEKTPGQSERDLESLFLREPTCDQRDRAFALQLVRGVMRWQIRLDWILKQHVKFPFGNIDPNVRNILRLALFQILFLDRVPDSAAVNEAVEQTRKMSANHVVKFVNGILRTICRNKARLPYPHPEKERTLHRSVYYAYPLWLIRKWERELGPDAVPQLLEAGNEIPSLIIRTNRLRTSRNHLLERFREEGIEAKTVAFAPDGIQLPHFRGSVTRLTAFQEGLFQVQGEAAQICSHLLKPQKGLWVMDVCAGLGGKSTHMAELMGDQGQILAVDTHLDRLRGLWENLKRLGIKRVFPVCADAAGSVSFAGSDFHKIMVDGPCSGLGVISKHPDIKLTKKEDDIPRLAMIQEQIILKACEALRPGGELLYVTCTISEDENESVVESMLSKTKNMKFLDLHKRMPRWGLALVDANGFLKTFPHVHGMEGFFAALFQKRPS